LLAIECPWCGPRGSSEFSCLGEEHQRPDPRQTSISAWRAYLYDHANLPTWSRERWVHAAGCGGVVTVTRHLATNEIRYDDVTEAAQP
jgi:heterotetrameric sarcosine oxidase delta subunit